jgi:translation initiation factor IF-1
MEGTVARVLGRGIMEIKCANDVVLRATRGGRLRKYRIKVLQGDRVQVRVSPYDMSHGLVTYRY